MDRRLDINLLPPEFQPQPAVRWHPIYLAALYSLALFLMFYIVIGSYQRVKKLEADITKANESVKLLQPFADAYDMSEQSVKSLENLKQLFVYLDGQYVDWPLFFYHLEPNIPSGVWLTSASAEVVTKVPTKKKPAAAATPPAAQPQGAGGEKKAPQGGAPATPAAPAAAPKEAVTPPPLRTGDITIEGVVNGYSLAPISAFLKNLQNDPYFVLTYLKDSALDEKEEGVTRSFTIVVRVKDPKQTAEEEAAKSKSKPKDATPASTPQSVPVAEGGHAQ
jgi:Tfp pilus assembly protein PilN